MENTPEFEKWFEGSKVVDENGNPLKVYHGTANLFDKFSKDYIGTSLGHPNNINYQQGFFFTTDPEEAQFAADMAPGKNPRIIEAYINIQSPYVIEIRNNEPIGYINKTSDPSIYYDNMADEIMNAAAEMKADGIIIKNVDTGKQIIIPFEPDQIRIIPEKSGSQKSKH